MLNLPSPSTYKAGGTRGPMHTAAEGRGELTQHGVLPCLAGGEGGVDDLYCDGRAVPPAMMYCTACPAKELLSCELLAITAVAAAAVGILNVHKTPS
jgi:hypothetical protein